MVGFPWASSERAAAAIFFWRFAGAGCHARPVCAGTLRGPALVAGVVGMAGLLRPRRCGRCTSLDVAVFPVCLLCRASVALLFYGLVSRPPCCFVRGT